jgi:hypothetical protein
MDYQASLTTIKQTHNNLNSNFAPIANQGLQLEQGFGEF